MANKITFKTPMGTAQYPWLQRADFEYDPDGIFKTSLIVPAEEAKPLMAEIKEAANDAFKGKADNAHMPFKQDEAGNIIFSAKSKYQPAFYDGVAQPIAEPPAVAGGSTLILTGTMYCYDKGGRKGVSLQLAGVQIVKLVERQAASNQFKPIEGGYVAGNDNAAPAKAEADTGGAGYNF